MPEIDVVHPPIFNMRGIGIIDGDVGDMERAIEAASGSGGVGVYSSETSGWRTVFTGRSRMRWPGLWGGTTT